jgi:hypothetical protein
VTVSGPGMAAAARNFKLNLTRKLRRTVSRARVPGPLSRPFGPRPEAAQGEALGSTPRTTYP